jgi:hypothetical protein
MGGARDRHLLPDGIDSDPHGFQVMRQVSIAVRFCRFQGIDAGSVHNGCYNVW